ncbi:hypothetical protein IEQ44_07725 [Nocardioides sp. Y6]|uniref:PH domain-containing protein n=1 Tax=Nocardioides malaquae TaxID=2773426 RepID=A0ABR9RSJ3_9ACTN|nr:hypothetical protein [Nocardioides malaquae]MBE7324538.1 hypothetical protein [Nocardioides malaquae]
MKARGQDLGPALPTRRGPVVAPLLLALVCGVPILADLRAAWWGGASDLGRAGSAAMLLVLVVLPLLLAGLLATYRVHVDDIALTWTWRGRARRTVRFDEMDQVVVGKELFRRPFRLTRDDVVVVRVTTGPHPRQVRVSTVLVRTLTPLLEHLAPWVAAHPELVAPEQHAALDELLGRTSLPR